MEEKELEQIISNNLIENNILPIMDFPLNKEIKIDIDPDEKKEENN